MNNEIEQEYIKLINKGFNTFFECLECFFDTVEDEINLKLLKLTYDHRNEIDNWYPMLDKVILEMISKNEDYRFKLGKLLEEKRCKQ